MADEHQIDRAFQNLGALFAAEHSEHDDQGARQVGRMIRLLRKFKAREQAEQAQRAGLLLPAIREATYSLPDGRQVWYDAGDAIRDVSDLYSVLEEESGTGSPNLENTQARSMLEHLQRGGTLAEAQIGLLRRLLIKHRARLEAFRRDRDGQDILDVPDGSPAHRIIDPQETA